MVLGSFFFKNKARKMLTGNWQTALVVTFFASIFLTIATVAQTVITQDVNSTMTSLSVALQTMPENLTEGSVQYSQMMELYQRLFDAILEIPQSTWILLLAGNVIALLITPALNLGCLNYFIHLHDGEDLGVIEGLTARLSSFLRVLWLEILIFVRILLWSLLLVVPGIIAAIRYSQAVYYLAEDPSIKATEAIRRSKESMKNMKMGYFMLQLSFIGWNLLVSLLQMLLLSISPIVALVGAQFASLAVAVYRNASVTAFYCAVSRPKGLETLVGEARHLFRQMGSMFGDKASDDGGDDE